MSLLKLYRTYSSYSVMDDLSYEKGFQKALMRIKDIKRRRRLVWIRNVAAIVLILLGASTVLFLITRDRVIEENQTLAQVMEPGDTRATLTLSSGRTVDLHNVSDSLIGIGGGQAIINKNEKLDYQGLDRSRYEVNIIKTPRGGEYNLVLADGTKVWLNAESELKYPVTFTGDTREITLSGEAYLEVAHNANKPFIVHTRKGAVEVLGTAFNIRDYSDEKQMATTLVEGKVCLSTEEGAIAILQPSMQGVVTGNNTIDVETVNVSVYTAWKDGLFSFRNQTLGQMMLDLSRWYDFKYWFENNAVKDIPFTGDIERYDNLESLLKVLEKTHEVRFEYNEGILLIK